MSHLLTPGVLQQAISGHFLYTLEYWSSTEYYLVKWDLSDGTIITRSPNIGGSVSGMACDNKHLYVYTGARRLRRYDMSNLDMLEEGEWFTNSLGYAMVTDGTYLYLTASSSRFYKIRISDFAVVGDVNIYPSNTNSRLILSGVDLFLLAGNYIYKINTSDLSQAAISPDYGYSLTMLFVHGDFVYYGGYTSQNLIKANKSDLSQAAIHLNIGRRPMYACVIGEFLYVYGSSLGTRRHYITDLTRDMSYSNTLTGSTGLYATYQKNKQLICGNLKRPLILDAEGQFLLNNTAVTQNYSIWMGESKTINIGHT